MIQDCKLGRSNFGSQNHITLMNNSQKTTRVNPCGLFNSMVTESKLLFFAMTNNQFNQRNYQTPTHHSVAETTEFRIKSFLLLYFMLFGFWEKEKPVIHIKRTTVSVVFPQILSSQTGHDTKELRNSSQSSQSLHQHMDSR